MFIEDDDTEEDEPPDDKTHTVNMTTTQEVETLLINVREPIVFSGSIDDNGRDWMKKLNNFTSLNKNEEKDKIIIFETLDQTLDQTVQRVLLCEATASPEENYVYTLYDRVKEMDTSDLMDRQSTSLDEMEKTLDRQTQTADCINKPEMSDMNFPKCNTCGEDREDNCCYKPDYSNYMVSNVQDTHQ